MRMLLADDHDLVLDGFRAMIEHYEPMASLATAKTLDEALKTAIAGPCFDLILLDLNMPGMAGLDGLKRMLEACPQSRVAVITGMITKSAATAALNAGAKGFIPKTLTGQNLIAALRLLAAGEIYAPADLLTEDAPTGIGQALLLAGLSPREQEVAMLVVTGASNKEIARALDLQEVTVKLHIRNLCRKLDVKNRTQIAVKLSQA
jgi:two-component system, NarL family, nitrate/nitrite response regulator NarL